jgi:RimJ/RimL family protein N-acetyltransferase
MVGDTNLFLSGDGGAEAEIMIAEVEARGKKMGWEAMLLMLRYGVEVLGICRYEVKIKMENIASIKMFNKIGFKEESRSEVFKEVTSVLEVTNEAKELLEVQNKWMLEDYKHSEDEV